MADVLNVTRSLVLGADNINYFEIERTTFDDDTYEETSKLIGPAAALGLHYADKFEQRARTMADNAKSAVLNEKRLTELDNNETAIFNIAGVSPKDVIQDRYSAELLADGWTIDDGTGPVPLVFTINAQNNLRYSINGGATAAAEYLRSVIRLNNYPTTGQQAVFYANERYKRYGSLPGGNVVIKKP